MRVTFGQGLITAYTTNGRDSAPQTLLVAPRQEIHILVDVTECKIFLTGLAIELLIGACIYIGIRLIGCII